MWCNYCDGFCINPICAFGCVEREQDRKDAKIVLRGLADIAASKRKDTTDE